MKHERAIPGLARRGGLDADAAARVIDGINGLRHSKGPAGGQPFGLRPWQLAVVEELFGRLGPDGRRQYRTCYIEIPRKNGKTTLAAAIALYMLCGDGEMGGEVYGAAADRDQAALVFNTAAAMVRADPDLSHACKVIDSQKRIVHHPSGSVYRAISAEAHSKHGFNASAIVYDELHAAPNRALYDVLTTSTGARDQPVVVVITTAGWDRQSICWELHEYAIKVRDGIIDDPSFLSVIYSADPDADWRDEEVWHAANPALGDFRSLEEMQAKARAAESVPAQQNAFRRLYLNQWTEQDIRAIDMTLWRACQPAVSDDELVGVPCFGGLDLGMSDDFSAFVRLWTLPDGRVVVKSDFWIPRATLERFKLRPYDTWRRAGALHVTEGDITDYDEVEAAVADACLASGVIECAYDPRFAAQLALHLEGRGVAMVNMPQGFQLNAACQRLFELIRLGTLCHGSHSVMDWMASNLVVRQNREQEVRPDKNAAAEKIDGIVALLMALARAITQPVEPEINPVVGVLRW